MSFARLVLVASTNDSVPPSSTSRLPPIETARAIAQFYMTNIYPLYPAFPASSVSELLDGLYADKAGGFSPHEAWQLWMVLAIGSTAQSRSMDDEYRANGLEFVRRALAEAEGALKPGFVGQIQSLLLLTQYSMLDPAHFDSWHLIGFTCRAVIDLGLHHDLPNLQFPGGLDARRRLFYCVYALDRWVGSTPLPSFFSSVATAQPHF